MARLLSLGEENSEDGREAIYERVKDVYGERSSLVHGSKRVDKVSPEIRKDAFDLTRACLQRIVCDPNLARLYSDERIKMGGKDTKLIDFYRKLDLGLDVEW